MPEERARSWARIRLTIVGFYKKHGRWPSRVFAPAGYISDLDEGFDPEGVAGLRQEVSLEPKADALRAEDDQDDHYDYGESLASRLTFPVPDPLPAWLAIAPAAAPEDPGGGA